MPLHRFLCAVLQLFSCLFHIFVLWQMFVPGRCLIISIITEMMILKCLSVSLLNPELIVWGYCLYRKAACAVATQLKISNLSDSSF